MAFPNDVVTQAFFFEDFIFTYNLASSVTANDVGKAVTLDTSAAKTMKLVGDDDVVYGRLETFEDRTRQGGGKVGGVSRKFIAKLPAATGHGIGVGDSVVGSATAGLVAAADTNNVLDNVVVEVGTDFVVVEKL